MRIINKISKKQRKTIESKPKLRNFFNKRESYSASRNLLFGKINKNTIYPLYRISSFQNKY